MWLSSNGQQKANGHIQANPLPQHVLKEGQTSLLCSSGLQQQTFTLHSTVYKNVCCEQ